MWLAALNNSCIWLNYGLKANIAIIYLIHLVGLVLHAFYLGCYYAYCPDPASMHKKFAFLASLIGCIAGYTGLVAEREQGIWLAGLIASVGTIFFLAVPLSTLNTVIKTKSSASMPFQIIIINLTVGTLMLTYAYLENNIFMMMPNVVGLSLNTVAIAFCFIYPSQPSKKSK